VDRRLVKLAVRQLVDNALKYADPGTPLDIAVRQDETGSAVSVSDTGREIPPAEQARVFDRFWRSPSVKRQIPGSGLGLSIAHGIARAHGGELTLTSAARRTTFELRLPDEERKGTR
jgi:signal transduction histidine kinase